MKRLLDHLQEWVDEKDNRNSAFLAKKAGFSPSTVRRILQGEAIPGEETAARLLKVTSTPEQFIDIMSKSFPDTYGYLRNYAETSKNSDYSSPEAWYRRDSLNFEIMISTVNKAGFAYSKLCKNLGEPGKKRIESLIDEGVLSLKDDRVYCRRITFSGQRDILDLTPHCAEVAKKHDDIIQCTQFYASSYKPEEYARIREKILEVVDTIDEINKSREADDMGSPTFIHMLLGRTHGEKEA